MTVQKSEFFRKTLRHLRFIITNMLQTNLKVICVIIETFTLHLPLYRE
jgi:hypothetical protein